ncbi:MAG: hypothetical protein KKD69_05010 [Euryarchaeota archaeon]|nr:hypothetical protein [Euryarchaeota archaeon]MBU4491805.1 hypothetical protein [Euryarchaeota archaeon]
MNDKTEEFLQKLAPCIERGELEACVEEAAAQKRKMDIAVQPIHPSIALFGCITLCT